MTSWEGFLVQENSDTVIVRLLPTCIVTFCVNKKRHLVETNLQKWVLCSDFKEITDSTSSPLTSSRPHWGVSALDGREGRRQFEA